MAFTFAELDPTDSQRRHAVVRNGLLRMLPHIGLVPRGTKILDVGCGTGLSMWYLSQMLSVHSVVMTDIEDLRDPSAASISFQIASADQLPYRDKAFHMVFIQFLLHHLRCDPLQVLLEARRLASDRIVLIEEFAHPDADLTRALHMDRTMNQLLHPGSSSLIVERFFTREELHAMITASGPTLSVETVIPDPDYLPLGIFVLCP